MASSRAATAISSGNDDTGSSAFPLISSPRDATMTTATPTSANGTNQAPTAFFGSGSSLDLAGSTRRRAFNAANQVHPSTQAPATAPAAIDHHTLASDQG